MEANRTESPAPLYINPAGTWASQRPGAAQLPAKPGPLTAAFSVETRILPLGAMSCSTCLQVIAADASMCPYCRCFTSVDGKYRGPSPNAPGAEASAIYAVIGLLFFGVILGPLAISHGNAAKRAIAEDPRLGGASLATFGQILGLLDIVAFCVALLLIGR